jgi:molybdopterin converting factor small subunit
MTIKVEFRGPLESQGVQTTYHVDIRNQKRVRDVLDQLLKQNDGLEEIFSDMRTVEQNTMVMLNEKDVTLFDGLDTKLEDGDNLLVLPLVHGG